AEHAAHAERLCLSHTSRTGRASEMESIGNHVSPPPISSPSHPGPWLYPISPKHSLHRRYRYRQGTEGYELEVHLNGKDTFLGFCDSLAEVQETIKDHLY